MADGTQTFSVSDDHIKYVVPQNVQDAYDIVLDVANRVLKQCRIFSIESLREENPTVTEIARRLRVICALMQELDECDNPEGDGQMVQKAHEYANHVQALANAIEEEDVLKLDHECTELHRRSFI